MTLTRSVPLTRRTGLKPGKALKRTAMKVRRQSPNDFPEEVKANVRRRSGNWCEVRATEVCRGRATQFHHRKLRAHGDNREVNCLHVCDACHDHVHAKDGRGSIGKSRLMGWLVVSTMDPAEVPVRRGGGT